MYELWSETKLLSFLEKGSIEEPHGFAIEIYRERFPINAEAARALERFLSSRNLDNRSAASEALVSFGKRVGYEADAMLLHFQSRDSHGGNLETYASLRFIEEMSAHGSSTAARTLALLRDDPYVQDMWA